MTEYEKEKEKEDLPLSKAAELLLDEHVKHASFVRPGTAHASCEDPSNRMRVSVQTRGTCPVTFLFCLQIEGSPFAVFSSGQETAMTTYYTTHNSEMERCIADCNECHDICLSTAMNSCLSADGMHVEEDHIRLMINTAEMCRTSADFMLSNSPLHGAVCAACGEVCEACARGCEQAGSMDDCVLACRRCAESCEDMARTHGYLLGSFPTSDAASMAHF